jgi:hypothetical protein
MKCNKGCDITKSPYCVSGIGRFSPECSCVPKITINRTLNGGPGLAEMLDKGVTSPAPDELSLILPDSVKSKESLSQYLQSLGHKRGTEAYWKYYKELSGKFKSEISYLNT